MLVFIVCFVEFIDYFYELLVLKIFIFRLCKIYFVSILHWTGRQVLTAYLYIGIAFPYFMIVVTKEDFISTYVNRKSGIKQALKLEKLNLLPLNPSSKLAIITAHLLGDGNLSKDVDVGDFRYFNKELDCIFRFKKTITNLFKIEPKQFYERKGGYVLKYNNAPISRLLELSGIPRGNKVKKSYDVPQWIKDSDFEIKKDFLRSLFDDELTSPKLSKKGYVETLRLRFNKREDLLESGVKFLNSVKELIEQLDVKCNNTIIKNQRYIDKEGNYNRTICINISVKSENIKQFYRNIGFNHNLKSMKLTAVTLSILRKENKVL